MPRYTDDSGDEGGAEGGDGFRITDQGRLIGTFPQFLHPSVAAAADVRRRRSSGAIEGAADPHSEATGHSGGRKGHHQSTGLPAALLATVPPPPKILLHAEPNAAARRQQLLLRSREALEYRQRNSSPHLDFSTYHEQRRGDLDSLRRERAWREAERRWNGRLESLPRVVLGMTPEPTGWQAADRSISPSSWATRLKSDERAGGGERRSASAMDTSSAAGAVGEALLHPSHHHHDTTTTSAGGAAASSHHGGSGAATRGVMWIPGEMCSKNDDNAFLLPEVTPPPIGLLMASSNDLRKVLPMGSPLARALVLRASKGEHLNTAAVLLEACALTSPHRSFRGGEEESQKVAFAAPPAAVKPLMPLNDEVAIVVPRMLQGPTKYPFADRKRRA